MNLSQVINTENPYMRIFEKRLIKKSRRRKKVQGNLQNYTWPKKKISSIPSIAECVKIRIKIHQKKTAYNVADVKNCAMNRIRLTNQVNLHVNTLKLKMFKRCAHLHHLTDAHSYPNFYALCREVEYESAFCILFENSIVT